MAIFGKVRPRVGRPREPLVKIISDLRDEEMPDDEIIKELRGKGYKSIDILEGIKQADLKATIGPPATEEDLPPLESEEASLKPSVSYPAREKAALTTEDIEEVAESIIEDKWKPVKKDISDIKKWKKDVDDALDEIKDKVEGLGDTIDRLKSSLAEKINSYSKSIDDVSLEIKAMDKVFRKILPTFTEDVKALSDAVDKLKLKKK